MLNTKITIVPTKSHCLKLITVSLHDLVNSNIANLSSKIEQYYLDDNELSMRIRLIYDINMVLNNKKQYKLDFDNDTSYNSLYSCVISSKRGNVSVEVWAKRIIKSFYHHLQNERMKQANLMPTNENVIRIQQAINNQVELFTPRAYINWIMPHIFQINSLKELNAIATKYIQLDRNHFANQIIIQPNWLDKLDKNKRLQGLIYRVLSVEPYEQARPTPATLFLLHQLYKVTSNDYKYEIQNLINVYSIAQ